MPVYADGLKEYLKKIAISSSWIVTTKSREIAYVSVFHRDVGVILQHAVAHILNPEDGIALK